MLYRSQPPAGWTSTPDVQAKIDDAYRRCLDLTAFNYTVRQEYDRLPHAGEGIEYKKHPKQLINIDPAVELRDWGARRGAPTTLDQEYQRHRAMLSSLPQAEWPTWITGKVVLKVFLEDFPHKSIPHETLKSIYIDKHPSPHAELVALVTRIVERNGQP